jgi:hypothetical protein
MIGGSLRERERENATYQYKVISAPRLLTFKLVLVLVVVFFACSSAITI